MKIKILGRVKTPPKEVCRMEDEVRFEMFISVETQLSGGKIKEKEITVSASRDKWSYNKKEFNRLKNGNRVCVEGYYNKNRVISAFRCTKLTVRGYENLQAMYALRLDDSDDNSQMEV